jgi:putative spermidine/putrescine transport system substrate-binding protein
VTVYSADALAQLRAQKNAPQYDVVHFSGGQEIAAAREGLISPMKPEELPNAANLYPFAKEGMQRGEGPVHLVTAIGLLYNEKKVPASPKSWKDLWDPKYGDHLLLTDLSNSYGLLGFLMMNKVWGGSIDNPKPGLDKVKELLNRSTIISSSPEVQQNFAQNDTWVAPFSQDYAHIIRQSRLPVKFVMAEEGTPAVFFTANLVAGRPNQGLAKKLIDFSLSPEVQEAFAREMRYSPTNQLAKLDPAIASEVVYGDAVKSLVRFDPAQVDAARPQLVESWKKLIAR